MRCFLRLWVWLALGLGSIAGAAPIDPQAPAAVPSPAPDDVPETAEYRVGSGDLLQLFVWKEPDMSRELMVRVDGKMTVPLLGDVEAAGRTPEQLSAEITKLFKKFLAAPQVTVGVLNANSARFFVLGMVQRPGDFPLRGRTSVRQGLALAGGFKEYAKTDGIVIVRQDRGTFLPKGRPSESFIPFNYKKLEGKSGLGDNILLRPGDTILVP